MPKSKLPFSPSREGQNSHFIVKCSTIRGFVECINYFSDNFAACQQAIIDFLKMNYSKHRALQFEKYLTHE